MSLREELKGLTAQERLAKLKELEDSRRKEIDEAKKLLSETVEELVAEEEKTQLPIDQLKAVNEGSLLTEEEKELFRIKHFHGKSQEKEESKTRSSTPRSQAPTLETAEDREKRLEQIAAKSAKGGRSTEEGKQYGSPMGDVLDEMKRRYANPSEVVYETAQVLTNTAYNHEMSNEEKWRVYAEGKAVREMMEQQGATSEQLTYVANSLKKFADRMNITYQK